MRWQPWARGAVALAGVTCAAAIYFSFHSRKITPGNTNPPVVEATETSKMDAGEYVRRKDGRQTLSIRYARRSTYSDGRIRFEQASMKSFDERALEVWADIVESKSDAARSENPAALLLNGHVKLRTKDGLEALMDSATYDDASGTLVTPGRVTFSRSRMSGEGMGATYNEHQDVLSLLDQSHVRVLPDEHGAGALDATSRQLTLLRPAKLVELAQDARIVRDGDVLSADNAVLHMTQDESRLTKIALHERARVEPGSGKETAAPPDMRADDIDLDLHDDGQTIRHAGLTSRTGVSTLDMASDTGHRIIEATKIALDLALDGQTLTRLDADERVVTTLPKTGETGARRIEADTLRAAGKDERGLTDATFEGRLVTYREELPSRTGPGEHSRTVKSQRLDLRLNGQLDAIDHATFTTKVDLKDPDGSATADVAQYDPGAKKMFLRAAPGSTDLPTARSEDRVVIAREIDLHTDSSDLEARIGVITRAQPAAKPADGRASSPLFEPGTQITGFANELKYVGHQATYSGLKGTPARLKQEQRYVNGNVIVYDSEASDLKATGNVESVMIAETTSKNGKPSAPPARYKVENADSLDYKDAARTALFRGAAVKVHSDDGDTTARSFDLKFAQDSGDIQQMVWDTAVRFALATGRKGVGDRLRYDAATGRYELAGSPAEVLSPKTPGDAQCAHSFGGKLTFATESGDAEGGLLTKGDMPCSTPLPYKKK